MTRKIYDYINFRQRNPSKPNQEFMKLGIPLFSQEEKQLALKDRLARFFITHGSYKITMKAEALPEVKDAFLKRGITVGYEQKDIISNRDKDEKYVESMASITPREKKRIIADIVADLIDNDKWQELFEAGAVKPRAPNGYWSDKKNRVYWAKELVSFLGKDPKDMVQNDFSDNGLVSVIDRYGGSPFKAVSEAYPEEKIKEWEMSVTPNNFLNKPENRIAAVRWLCEKLGKDPRDLIVDDFDANRLGGLIYNQCEGSPFKAVSEAFPGLGIKAWEMSMTPMGFFEKKENRVAAVKWLAEKLNKDPRDLAIDDFRSNRLRGLIDHYQDSPFEAVSEAFPGLGIKAWEMLTTPMGFFDKKENRIAAVKWLAEKLNKEPRDLTKDVFLCNRLTGLLYYHYNNSPFAAVSEAFSELGIKAWEMLTTPMGFFDKKENRIAAVKCLAEKLNKDPRDFTANDFRANRLEGLLGYYGGSPFEAVSEAYPQLGLQKEDMEHRGQGPRNEKGQFSS